MHHVREPLAAPLIALALGIVASRWQEFPPGAVTAAGLALAALAVVARWHVSRRTAWAAGLAAVFCSGILVGQWRRPGPPPRIEFEPGETMLLAGCVVEPTAQSPDREQVVVELAAGARVRVNWYMREGEQAPGLRYGQQVEFEARLRRPRNYGNPGSFDFAGYLARRNIYWTASANARDPVRVLPGECGRAPYTWIYRLREGAVHRLDALYAGEPYARGMTRALLVGDTAMLERVWADDFRRTGTYHALVISGLHLTLLTGWFLMVLRVIGAGPGWSLASTAAVAWIYAAMAGGSAPIVRAAAGLTLFLAGRCLFRKPRVLNLLAAVAIGFLLADPEQLFDASFQLSFLSVALIGAVASPVLARVADPYARGLHQLDNRQWDPHLEPEVAQMRVELRLLAETARWAARIPERWTLAALAAAGRLLVWAFSLALVSTVVQAGLVLPMAIYFHRLSLSGLTANLLIVPCMNGVVLAGFAAVATGWQWPARLAAALLDWVRDVAAWHARLEPALRIPDPPAWVVAGFLAGLLLVWMSTRVSRMPWRIALAAPWFVFLALVVAHPFPPQAEPGHLEMVTLDVGQGDGLLIGSPGGRWMLVDAGGFPVFGKRPTRPPIDIGEEVVSPYLFARGIRRVDIVVVTHAHDDHIGGLRAVVENFQPSEVWTGAFPPSAAWMATRRWIESRGIAVRAPVAGYTREWGGARISVLSPPGDYEPAAAPKNNDSLVLRASFGRSSLLLTGDVERAMEARLLADGRLEPADVLKVAHHGSKTSSTEAFLDAVKPRWAVISAGNGNLFRHPHQEVLDRLAERGIGIWRTDELGQVRVLTDGRRWRVESFAWPVPAAPARR